MTRVSKAVQRAERLLQKKKQQKKIEDKILLGKIEMDLRKKRWARDEANEKANDFMDDLYNKLESPRKDQ